MRTTIEMPDSLLKKAKKLASEHGTTLREVVIEGVRLMLERHRKEPSRFALRDASFGHGGLAEGIVETDWEKIRELAYEGRGG
jgi:hypothetical protein